MKWQPFNDELLSGTIRDLFIFLVCCFHLVLAVKVVSWLLMVCFGSTSYLMLPAFMISLQDEHLNAQGFEFISLRFSEFSSCSGYNIKKRWINHFVCAFEGTRELPEHPPKCCTLGKTLFFLEAIEIVCKGRCTTLIAWASILIALVRVPHYTPKRSALLASRL